MIFFHACFQLDDDSPNFYQCEMLGKFTSPSINLKLIGLEGFQGVVETKKIPVVNASEILLLPEISLNFVLVDALEFEMNFFVFIV